MKQIFFLPFFIALVNPIVLVGQKTPCVDIYQAALKDTIKDAKGNYNYQKALEKINAIYLCLDSFKNNDAEAIRKKTNQLNIDIYKKINAAKVLADQATIKVKKSLAQEQKAKEQAIIEKNNATALYWTSEAEKINPIQGLRLLEKAYSIANDKITIDLVMNVTQTIFNSSNSHRFQEKRRMPNTIRKIISPNCKWLVTTNLKDGYNIYEIATGKLHKFLKSEKKLNTIEFSPDSKWIITQSDVYKIWDIDTGTHPTFLKNEKRIVSVTFSPNNKWLITKNEEGISKIWDISTHKFFDYLQGENNIKKITFSPDSKLIGIVNAFNEAKILEINVRLKEKIFIEKGISEIVFSPDSKLLITKKDFPNTVTNNILYVCEFWEISSCTKLEFLQNEKNIREFYFSSNNKWLITLNSDYEAKVWEMPFGMLHNFLKGKSNIHEIIFSSNDKMFISISGDGIFDVWEVEKGRSPSFLSNETDIGSVLFSQDSKWIIIGYGVSPNYTYKIWEIDAGKSQDLFLGQNDIRDVSFSLDVKWTIIKKGGFPYNEKLLLETNTGLPPFYMENKVMLDDISVSHDGKWLITLDNNAETKFWNSSYENLYLFLKDEKYIGDTFFSPNYNWLITESGDFANYEYKFWNVKDVTNPLLLKDEKKINSVSFSQYGKWLFYRNIKLESKIRNISTGKLYNFLNIENYNSGISFSTDEKWLIAAKMDSSKVKFNVWEIESENKCQFLSREGDFYNAIFSPDSKWLVTINTRKKANIWNLSTGKTFDFLSEERNIDRVMFSPDSKWLITTNEEGESKIWDFLIGKEHKCLLINKDIFYASFSSDGKWLSINGTNIWNLLSGEAPIFLSTSNTNIRDASFSADSQWLITRDKAWTVWDVQIGKQLDFFKIEPNINSAYFSDDSQWVITVNGQHPNNTFKIWDIKTGKQPEFLKQIDNIRYLKFSNDGTTLIIICKHKVKTYEVATGKLIQTLWLNKVPTQVDIIDNRHLYVTVGKAIVKTDLQTQQGNLMSYGDGEPLDYQYDEIMEWKKAFEKEYLLPLDEEIKKKYGIK